MPGGETDLFCLYLLLTFLDYLYILVDKGFGDDVHFLYEETGPLADVPPVLSPKVRRSQLGLGALETTAPGRRVL